MSCTYISIKVPEGRVRHRKAAGAMMKVREFFEEYQRAGSFRLSGTEEIIKVFQRTASEMAGRIRD